MKYNYTRGDLYLIDRIAIRCSMENNIHPHLIFTNSREQEIAETRHLVIFILKTEYHWSVGRIAEIFKKDISTIRHSVKRGDQLKRYYKELFSYFNRTHQYIIEKNQTNFRHNVCKPER